MNKLNDLQKALDKFPKWHDWKDNPKMIFDWQQTFKELFSVFQRTFFAKELSLRKLLKERPAYLKSYDDGCNKQHLIQLLTIFEDWAKSLEKVFDETPQVEKNEIVSFLLELLPKEEEK